MLAWASPKLLCTVLTPLVYEAHGTCQWTSTGTEAPQVTDPPDPSQSACDLNVAGDVCYFTDASTLLTVEGKCSASTVLGFTGLTCEPDGQSEIPEELACDNKATDAPCTVVTGDGFNLNGGQSCLCWLSVEKASVIDWRAAVDAPEPNQHTLSRRLIVRAGSACSSRPPPPPRPST
jgi:hypothetical protein